MYIVLHNEQNNYLYLIEKDAAGGEVGEVLQPYIYNCVSAPLNVLC